VDDQSIAGVRVGQPVGHVRIQRSGEPFEPDSRPSAPVRPAVSLAAMELSDSERHWLRVRDHLRRYRYELAVAAAEDYPRAASVAGTPLLAPPAWRPAQPRPLVDIALSYRPTADLHSFSGNESAAAVLPTRSDGSAYRTYSEAMAALARPGLFENRPTFRLLDADLLVGRMEFGLGTYFDSLNVGEAGAHEYAAASLGEPDTGALRAAVGDPCDPRRRPVNVAVSTLTLRHDRNAGAASMVLHRRDAAAVGHAGGMVQVLPVGVFQPTSDQPADVRNDFSLWRSMTREFAEELLGQPELTAPVDYGHWPFAAALTDALDAGRLRAYVLGMGVDPLTFATDLLAAVVIDAPVYDDLFGAQVAANDEGSVLADLPFDAATTERYARHEPTQAAGAALLALAWQHRAVLLG
jgi:hypothetical protein